MPESFLVFRVDTLADRTSVQTSWVLVDTVVAKEGAEALRTCVAEGEMPAGVSAVAVPEDCVVRGVTVVPDPGVEVQIQ